IFLTMVVFMGMSQIGFWAGQRHQSKANEAERSEVQTLQASTLGLVGLLLAFSFSLAITRYDERRHVTEKEANEIDSTFLRTDFLPDPEAGQIRDLLKQYLLIRLSFSDDANYRDQFASISLRSEALQRKMWALARSAMRHGPLNTAGQILFFTSLNSLFDL